MPRFFVDSIDGGFARVTGDDVRHIVRVLRLRIGDEITLCDGHGRDCSAVIAALSDDAVECNAGEPYPSRSEPACRITLFQCLPKTGKLETIVQKCTELGVHAVVPVMSQRCVVQPTSNFEIRRVRYQRVAEEAAKQSRRGIIPAFSGIVRLADVDPASFDLFLAAYEDEQKTTLKAVLRKNRSARRVGILVGPEGGFTEAEIGALTARGAVPVTLGARILRTETAGMTMVAQILYEVEK